MNKEQKQYYEKVLVSSGELPEKEGEYYIILKDGSKNADNFNPKSLTGKWGFWNPSAITAWLKPYSPKEEAVEFVEWLNSLETLDLMQFKDPSNPTSSELYDKFKEEKNEN